MVGQHVVLQPSTPPIGLEGDDSLSQDTTCHFSGG